jgi:hypothetical protein
VATVKTYLVAVGCGVLLLGAVSAHAGSSTNGLTLNGSSTNGLRNQELLLKETNRNGEPTSAVQSESLPFNSLSQKGLGKTHP